MSNDLTITPEKLTPEIVKQRICPSATDQEIFLFLQVAKSCKLNPFLNQIYLVKYGDKPAQILTSYNVYIQRAEMSGVYGGLETTTEGSVDQGNLKAVVKVYRKDWERPLIHEVYYDEYVQQTRDRTTGQMRPNKFWAEKPRTMIVKVAISQAFRLAFPVSFEGMPYTRDEMPEETSHASSSSKPDLIKEPKAIVVEEAIATTEPEPEDSTEVNVDESVIPEAADPKLLSQVRKVAGKVFNKDKEKFSDWLVWNYNKENAQDLNDAELEDALLKLKKGDLDA